LHLTKTFEDLESLLKPLQSLESPELSSWIIEGYWRQGAAERLGIPSRRCTDRDGRPPRGPPGGALLALLRDLLGMSRSVECELLSVVTYPRYFSSVFIVPYRLLLCYSIIFW